MQIRLMQESDLAQVLSVENCIFSRPWSEKSLRDAFQREDTIYLVAVDETVIGYCGIWCSLEDGDLCNMAVLPEWRRNGVGRQLLEEALAHCRGRQIQRILLEVRESNEPARQLYRNCQFREIGRRKAYYTQPKEDAILMECLL